jgi:hypothetical protein
MEGPMREVAFSQTHRRTHRRRNIVVSQFNDPEIVRPIRPDETATRPLFTAGLAWRYIVQSGDDGPWTTFRRVAIAVDASDDEVVQTVVRYLAGPGWDRDPAQARVT